MTLLLGSFVVVSGALTVLPKVYAGTVGSIEADQTRLQDEVTNARNELDALVLKPGLKLDDPRVKEKAAALEEKMKAFRKGFRESLTPPPGPTSYPNKVKDLETTEGSSTSPAREAPPPEFIPAKKVDAPPPPETVLSGEGIQSEIIYPKKGAAEKSKSAVKGASPDAAPTPVAEGLSEIQYPKKSQR